MEIMQQINVHNYLSNIQLGDMKSQPSIRESQDQSSCKFAKGAKSLGLIW